MGWPLSRTSSATEKDDLMAVPKRRTSKRKKRARRTHYKAAPIALQPCPRCGDLKRPHRVCPTCGYYRDEQRVAVEDA
jgi:large subunit ribosomal protein L32